MKVKKIFMLGYCSLLIFCANINPAKAQNSEKKIREDREKVQKADSIDKTFKNQKKRVRLNATKGNVRKN